MLQPCLSTWKQASLFPWDGFLSSPFAITGYLNQTKTFPMLWLKHPTLATCHELRCFVEGILILLARNHSWWFVFIIRVIFQRIEQFILVPGAVLLFRLHCVLYCWFRRHRRWQHIRTGDRKPLFAFLQLHEDRSHRRPTGSKNANTVRAILPPILNFCEDCEESEDFQKPFQFWFSLAWRSKKIWSRALSLSVVGLSCCLCCRILGCMLDGSAGILYLSISCKWDHLRHSTLRGTIMALLSKRLNANSKLIPQNKAGLIPVIDWLTYIISDLSA